MPSPLLHTAVGAACAKAEKRSKLDKRSLFVFAVVANLPDIDLLPGIICGEPARYHHELTHSFAFALASAAAAAAYRRFSRRSDLARPGWFWLLTAALSHPILDLFTYPPPTMPASVDHGLWLAWPLSRHAFAKLYPAFEGLNLSMHPTEWLTLASLHTLVVEAVIGGCVFGIVSILAKPAAASSPTRDTEHSELEQRL